MDQDQEKERLCNLPFIPVTDFIIMKNNLGHGSFGQVKKAIWQGKDVAIKSMFPSNTSNDNFRREAEQLSRVKHENIINVYGWTELDNDLGLVMEFADCGNLYDFLHNDNAEYTLSHAISWCLQCANGVRYLHSLNIIHRDLKPSNLLLTNKCRTIKLCDFGTARDKKTSMSIQQGTPSWMAPEVFRSRNYSEKCDVFSFGIILWEVFTRKIPFENYQQQYALMWAINKGTRPPRIRGCPAILADLIENCWKSNQHIRPSMDKVVKILEKLHELIPYESNNPIELSPKEIYRIQITNVSNSDSLKLKNSMNNTRTSADDHFLAPRDSTKSNLGHKRSNSTDVSLIIETNADADADADESVNEEDIQELFRHFNAYLFLRKEFYPLEPEIKDTKSMMIFEEHKKLALELFRLSRSNEHLQNRLKDLEKKRNQTPREYDDYTDYLFLKNENRGLKQARSNFAKDLMELNKNSIPYQRSDDEWILVDHNPLGSKTKHK